MTVRATLHIVSLAALIAIGGQAAVAKGDGQASKFAEIDSDSNGQVTEAEMRAHVAARFAAADSNGDGFLTTDEMLSARKAHGGKYAEKMLKKFDKDGNGSLDASELEAAAESRQGKRGKRMMSRLDANDDGKLALEEMTARRDPAKMIKTLDKDGNGTLSADEFAEMRKHGKKRHGNYGSD